jgi:heme/copper-type cytochrome/quinol oxidase subunit 2
MGNYTIVRLWLLTVILGSVVLTIYSGAFQLIFLLLFISLVLSIPAIALLLIFNNYQKNKQQKQSVYKKKILAIHLIIGLVYIVIGLLIIDISVRNYYGLIVLLYLFIGITFWLIHFHKQKKLTQKE